MALIQSSPAIRAIVSFRVDNLSLCRAAVVGAWAAAEAWSHGTSASCVAPSVNQLADERSEHL